jgi:predicted RNA-binding Zn-ribbon protein involved in translation (DUF1610 family)
VSTGADAAAAARRAGPLGAVGCPDCGSHKLTRLAMTLTDGSPVQFASCHRCEWHGWTQRGAGLPLATVLAKAARRR